MPFKEKVSKVEAWECFSATKFPSNLKALKEEEKEEKMKKKMNKRLMRLS
jgi:hypothetical protein